MDTDKPKTMKEIEGWTQRKSIPGMLKGSLGYGIFLSPDTNTIAQVNLTTEEIVLMIDRQQKRITYIHPLTIRGMQLANLSKDEMESVLKGSAKDLDET